MMETNLVLFDFKSEVYSAQKDPAKVKKRLPGFINFYILWPSWKDHEPWDFKDELDMGCWDQ